MYTLYKIDVILLHWFNSWVGWRDWIDWTIFFRVEILPYFFMAGFLLFALFYKNGEQKIKNRLLIIEALAAVLISRFIITEIIRLFYNRPRPFEIIEGLNHLLEHAPDYSFPSGHAAFFFPIAVTVFLYYKKTGALFIFAALQLTLTRVAAGFHWPSDILVGIIVAAISSLSVHYYEKKLSLPFKDKIVNFCRKF